MGHHHAHNHLEEHSHGGGHNHVHAISNNLRVAFFLNLAFTLLEFGGSVYTNSMAILSDAIHDLGDTIAIGSALLLEKFSLKGRDKTFSYGYRRFSPLSALINSLILFGGSIVIIVTSIPRFLQPEEVNAEGMFWISILGVIFNGVAVFRLGKSESLNQRTVRLHLLEDTLGWIAVLAGSLVIYYFGFLIIDPILSIAIALFVLINAYRNLRSSLRIFLQGTPKGISVNEVKEYALKVDGVMEVHDVHLWSLDGEYNILTAHIVVDNTKSSDEIADIKTNLREALSKHHVQHATLEIEFKDEDCELEDC